MEKSIDELYEEVKMLRNEVQKIKEKDESISRFVQKLKNNDFLISEEEFMECLN